MEIGMLLHRLAPPRPHKPSFTLQIPTTISPSAGAVTLCFYTPKNYESKRKLGKPAKRYPVLLNFHGGGFTLGAATDDARWATTVVQETGAVVASVDYRLAPRFPFPTAVEDGVDAVLYVIRHAEELHLDANRIAISGFSAGGNLTFTVPMRLMEEVDPTFEQVPPHATGQTEGSVIVAQQSMDGVKDAAIDSVETGSNSSPTEHRRNPAYAHPQQQQQQQHSTKGGSVTLSRSVRNSGSSLSIRSIRNTDGGSPEAIQPLPPFKIVALVSWYPSCDYTLTRNNRQQTLRRKDMEISPVFTELFDASYIGSPNLDKSNPYLSPGVAPETLLRNGLPEHVALFTCEWDMLRAEALALGQRLKAMGKAITHEDVKGVPHGWDKNPNPFKEAMGAKKYYRNACKQLRVAFAQEDEDLPSKSIVDRLHIGERLSTAKKSTEPLAV